MTAWFHIQLSRFKDTGESDSDVPVTPQNQNRFRENKFSRMNHGTS